ncbi:baseplate J/gp47 family protein [Mycobacterium sp. 050134]|uniref:baseplate J/gp47 family protein n=1 Tax=Mycobacterium sp. 050134 TaxID=3096111 RepID=UPI002ED87B14
MSDRLGTLIASSTLNGIDFVEVTSADQTSLRVHFLNTVPVQGTLAANDPVTINGGESVVSVPVAPIAGADWAVDDDGRPTLDLHTPFPGDFSRYLLHIDSTVLDSFYASVRFSFKAGCPTDLDCAPVEPCGRAPGSGPAIDYLAKDFTSFRAALLDYSASAYPEWVERDEPDLGIMLVELLSAAGDDLSYLQDRIANEATLATATQRSSVIRHARLVDYEPRPATSARVLMQIDVSAANIPALITVQAPLPDDGALSFELGDGLLDPDTGALAGGTLPVDPRWNRGIRPYIWDDSHTCLPVGATEMWVHGHGYDFPTGDPQLGTTGIALLIDTAAANPADPPTREVVHLTNAIEETDKLLGDTPITHLGWAATESLTAEHDLTNTVLAGNLINAVEGRRYSEDFVIDPDPSSADAAKAAVARSGPDAGCGDPLPYHLHTLTQGRLSWLQRDDTSITPEVCVTQEPTETGGIAQVWRWRGSLLDADQFENAYTVEPLAYSDIRADRSHGLPWFEYDGDAADSVRFGTGPFGNRPPAGARFAVTYRVTAGQAGNVAADSITAVPPSSAGVLTAVTNPFPAAGGADEEPIAQVRANAPHAFRVHPLRAVRPEDYNRVADELSWVLDAGTVMRWTGSWTTVFTTAQPRDAEQAGLSQFVALDQLLGRRRLAGYEVYTPDPRYVALDVVVFVCAQPWAFRAEVESAVLEQLGTGPRCDGRPGFWASGQFQFGTPLLRSELEAAAQHGHGVDGVLAVDYRRRGHTVRYLPMPQVVSVGADEILRCDQDLSHPDRGSLRVVVEGGK